MCTVREICRKLRNFFQELYMNILAVSIISIILIVFLCNEFNCNSHWKDLLHYIELERCAPIVTMGVFMVVLIRLIIWMNAPSFNKCSELLQLEMQKRNADIEFAQLLADIEKFEAEDLHDTQPNEIARLKSLILANDDMQQTIKNMQEDVRKLLFPNEEEVDITAEDKRLKSILSR